MKFINRTPAMPHALASFSLLILLLFSFSLSIQAQTNFNFAAPTDGAGTAGAETGRNICADVSGNVYVVGVFTGGGAASDFDLSAASTSTFTSVNQDGFIVSYDKNGTFRWKTIISGTGNEFGAPGGAICTNGTFVWFAGNTNISGSPQIISASGTVNITSTTATVDIVAGKLNCSNGGLQWATAFGGATNSDIGEAICIDPDGSCYVMGAYTGSFTLNGITAPAPSGSTDLFIAKLSSTGTLIHFASGGGSGPDMIVNGGGICYVPGATPSIVAAGSYSGATATFGSFNSITNSGGAGVDAVLLELDSTLVFTNALGIGAGASTDELLGAVYDPNSGAVYVCGYFNGPTITFPGTAALTQSGVADMMIARYSVAANNFTWAKQAGGTLDEKAYAISADGKGGIFISGYSRSVPCTFGTTTVNGGNTSNDIIAAKYKTDGSVLWALAAGGTSADEARGIYNYIETTPVYTQSVYLFGIFQATVNFNGTTLTADGGNDFFLARINDASIILPLRLLSFSGRRLNNTVNKLQWETSEEVNSKEFIIEKSDDGRSFRPIGSLLAGNTTTVHKYDYEDQHATATAWYQLKMVDIDGRYKYSNIIRLTPDDIAEPSYLFPNPVTGSFQLHTEDLLLNTITTIRNAGGAVLKTFVISNRNITINIQELPAGIYFVSLQNGKTLKLLKE